ncbi:MAG: hypothetical protein GX580_12670 [Candidatus Hydrogenedens sp.]|nr:hypothetical protein [Candidatus Hydrogenedentota bacterium]NLF58478.1 hypothetical protein [Candidatus Hydrogenedens sp.]
MPIGHGNIIEHQKSMKFPVLEMPFKMTGHTPAAGEAAAVCGKTESFGDLEQDKEQEQEQEEMLTPICQSVTSPQL